MLPTDFHSPHYACSWFPFSCSEMLAWLMFIKFVVIFDWKDPWKCPVGKPVLTDRRLGMPLRWGLWGTQCKVTAVICNCIDRVSESQVLKTGTGIQLHKPVYFSCVWWHLKRFSVSVWDQKDFLCWESWRRATKEVRLWCPAWDCKSVTPGIKWERQVATTAIWWFSNIGLGLDSFFPQQLWNPHWQRRTKRRQLCSLTWLLS